MFSTVTALEVNDVATLEGDDNCDRVDSCSSSIAILRSKIQRMCNYAGHNMILAALKCYSQIHGTVQILIYTWLFY